MKPRIFISSTCYDLKHIRDELLKFIRAHGLEPVLSERGDIGYSSGARELDQSCYEAVESSDMIILIVGNRYGSPASGEEDKVFDDYISVTRKEFKTAIANGMPIFCFADDKVLNEYELYKSNINNSKIDIKDLNFTSIDNINIFKFIQEIYSLKHISMVPFSHVSDIEDFMNKQFSDMIRKHLESLKNEKQITEMQDAMSEMQFIMKKMDIMIDNVGKKLLEKNGDEYKKILDKQDEVLISNLCERIIYNLEIYVPVYLDKNDVIDILIDAIKRTLKAAKSIKSNKKLQHIFISPFHDNSLNCYGNIFDVIPEIQSRDNVYNRIFSDKYKCDKLKFLLNKKEDGFIFESDSTSPRIKIYNLQE